MSTSARNVRLGPKLSARAVDVRTSDTDLAVRLEDGRTVAAPLAWFPRLERATPEQRKKWKLIGRGVGIHWPDIDEDISVENLLGSDGELLAYRDDAARQNAAEPVADDPPAARTRRQAMMLCFGRSCARSTWLMTKQPRPMSTRYSSGSLDQNPH